MTSTRSARPGDPTIQCVGKQPLDSFGRAQAVATRANRNADKHYAPYRCSCGSWHVGNSGIGYRARRAKFKKRRGAAKETE